MKGFRSSEAFYFFAWGCRLMYPEAALDNIDNMPQSTFDEIVEKYVEMNVAHPFREGNGRSMRIWPDHILRTGIGKAVAWSKVDKCLFIIR